MLERMPPSRSAAISIASSARVPPQKSPRRPGPVAAAWSTTQDGHCGTPCPSASSADSTAAVRSGRPAPSVAQWTGTSSPAAYAWRSASTSSAGGLDTTMTEVVASSAASAARACFVERPETAAERSRPPTPRQWLTPTPAASSRHITCWAPVPDAATMPTWPWRTALAKPRATPPTTAVPQSGPMTRTSAAAAASLSRTSSSTGTLSEKSITETPRWIASSASTVACCPGTETRARLASGGSDRAAERAPGRRLAEAAGVRARRLQLRERGVEGGPARGEPLVGAADGDHEVVGARLGRDGEAHRGDHLGVELGRHGDLGRLDAGGGGHGS